MIEPVQGHRWVAQCGCFMISVVASSLFAVGVSLPHLCGFVSPVDLSGVGGLCVAAGRVTHFPAESDATKGHRSVPVDADQKYPVELSYVQ